MGATTYLVPPPAIVMGWLFLGETPTLLAFAGGALSSRACPSRAGADYGSVASSHSRRSRMNPGSMLCAMGDSR